MKIKTDILILGTGIAGLSTALKLAKKYRVLVVSKKEALETNTRYAQGGIASVTSSTDDFKSHVSDTLKAGAGLCHKDVVEAIVKEGPELIKELVKYGVHFSTQGSSSPQPPLKLRGRGKASSFPPLGSRGGWGSYSPSQISYDLGKEGGHSHRRILHAGDTTGNEIAKTLLSEAQKNSNITILEYHTAIDLITSQKLGLSGKNNCYGAYILNEKSGTIKTIQASITILATGGAGKVYLYTSNPDVATGDGLAMGFRAGATLSNLEFVQFHPTCLYNPGAWAKTKLSAPEEKSFLITEALRGEGGILKLKSGKPFMQKYHRLKDLAPRDIVARAIDAEMKKTGDDYVLLDISHKDSEFIKKRFPHIYKTCLKLGLDITSHPIPVVPAAHYFCGGIKTDLNAKTDIQNLFAVGEVAATGLHGANRLASNSLLEALATSANCVETIFKNFKKLKMPKISIPTWNSGKATHNQEGVVISQSWDEIRRVMSHYVGIVRSDNRLERALSRIRVLKDEINEYYWKHVITRNFIELRNVACVAELIISSALFRHESRGLHYNTDYPKLLNKAVDTYIQKIKGVFMA